MRLVETCASAQLAAIKNHTTKCSVRTISSRVIGIHWTWILPHGPIAKGNCEISQGSPKGSPCTDGLKVVKSRLGQLHSNFQRR